MDSKDIIVVGAGPAGATAAGLLAAAGRDVLLVDKAAFPRGKTCAGWVNAKTPERFGHIGPILDEVEATPFENVRFYSRNLSKNAASDFEGTAGYLVERATFDSALVDWATSQGAEFQPEKKVAGVEDTPGNVVVTFEDGASLETLFVVGADGVQSTVGASAGMRGAWPDKHMSVCANEDVRLPESTIAEFYGDKRDIMVVVGYGFMTGYAWVFPKKRSVAVGLGGNYSKTSGIGRLFERFTADAAKARLIPPDAVFEGPEITLSPTGAAVSFHGAAAGRIVLVGDAGGFTSGSTGEGIYPGMVSAEVAAGLLLEALQAGNPEVLGEKYDTAWRAELESYLKPPGINTMLLLSLLFRDQRITNKFARAFLSGEDI